MVLYAGQFYDLFNMQSTTTLTGTQIAPPDSSKDSRSSKSGSTSEARGELMLGRLRAAEAGPSIAVLGALHGNETSGAKAAERVMAVLHEHGLRRGEIMALVGNPHALEQGQRFVDRDLNRSWSAERISHLRAEPEQAHSIEDRRMLELAKDFDELRKDARGPCYLLDLHSTSGSSIPFLNVGDTLPGRGFARGIPVPVVLGLDETLTGTLLQYIEGKSFVGVVFEAGQHDDPKSIDHAEAAIWIVLEILDLLPQSLREKADWARALLTEASHGEHHMFDVMYRHHLEKDNNFRMVPGFSSFQRIRFGDLLANENGSEVLAPHSGSLLMPLYQAQGEDGFFLMKVWGETLQWISRVVRKLRLDSFFAMLPGVTRPAGEKRKLWVSDPWRRGRRELIVRLLGYRIEVERKPGRTLLARRRQRPPTSVTKAP